ncbi:hypothetical protein [Bifidobacterium felsineum]|uniref:Ethanolamine utilization protein EutL n=1 Tax=Bifidobacterium felsineum TaxID=2045440 RepID=A0A2M9HLM4_9BIFI|nr:hypothetical protein [Bifidobacterium felsineum]MBT1163241.1 hypothetical protein [Bifidobacterium felsineum]PJM77707.1 hypothetical protein CSQ86_01130 [Bifidobacterium felsineum]
MTSNNINPNIPAKNTTDTAATEPIANGTAYANNAQGTAQPNTAQPVGASGNASNPNWNWQQTQQSRMNAPQPNRFGTAAAINHDSPVKAITGKAVAIIVGISLGCGILGGLGGGLAYGAISHGSRTTSSQQMQMPGGSSSQGGQSQGQGGGMPGGMPGQSNGKSGSGNGQSTDGNSSSGSDSSSSSGSTGSSSSQQSGTSTDTGTIES